MDAVVLIVLGASFILALLASKGQVLFLPFIVAAITLDNVVRLVVLTVKLGLAVLPVAVGVIIQLVAFLVRCVINVFCVIAATILVILIRPN